MRTEIGGEICASDGLELELAVDETTLPNDWDREQVFAEEIAVINNGAELCRCPLRERQRVCVAAQTGWLRADLIGGFHGRKNQRIAMTNPIFVR